MAFGGVFWRYARENAEQIRAAAFAAGQFSAAISAVREIGVLSGKRIERNEHGRPSEFADLENMTTDELRDYVASEISALGLGAAPSAQSDPARKAGRKPH
jgi:hypothetical protein